MLEKRFDLAVRIASRLPDDSTLVARKLCELQNGLYTSPAYLARYGTPQQPQDLLKHIGLRLQRELARHGMSIVGIDSRFAQHRVEQGLLQRVRPEWRTTQLSSRSKAVVQCHCHF